MEYNEAVDILAGPPVIRTMAEALGVSENTISQTRLSSKARRPPPKGWVPVVRSVAQRRIDELTELLWGLADA